MVSIPLISGTSATENADFIEVLPCNLEPVSADTGISKGYIRSTYGAITKATGPGVDRGAILWNGALYRVMGTKLVSVSTAGIITILADVGGSGAVGLAYGFDRLGIQSGTNLFYWDGTTLTQVTDPDLGPCIDVAWLNGQYFSTDGTYIIATDIADPTNINPVRYGAAESDPDMVVGLLPLRDEMYVFGANTIEVQSYVGGTNFPLQSNPGATIPVGCVGPRAKCLYSQSFAFCGAPRNGQAGVYVAGGGSASKLSTRIVDDMIAAVADQSTIELESINSRDEQRLYVHLPDRSLVYLHTASNSAQTAVWFVVRGGRGMDKAYRPRHAILFNGQFWVGDTETAALGTLTEGPAADADRVAFLSMTIDGETWSPERPCSVGKLGQRINRVAWRPHRRFSNYLGLKFRGETGLPQFGEPSGWQFQSQLLYNNAKGAILHDAELIGLPGRGVQGWAALEATVETLST